MELDASGSDVSDAPPPIPPTPTPGSAPKPQSTVFGVNGHDKPLLSSLSRSQPGSRDTKPRPSHGSSKTRGSQGEEGSDSKGTTTGHSSRVGGSLGESRRGSIEGSGKAELSAPILSLSPLVAPSRGLHPPLVTQPHTSEPVQLPSAAQPSNKTEQSKR